MEPNHPCADFVARAPEVEAAQLEADLFAVMRQLHRMRPALQALGAWCPVEAACVEVNRSRTMLKLKQTTTKENLR